MTCTNKVSGEEVASKDRYETCSLGMTTLHYITCNLLTTIQLCLLYLICFLDRTNIGNAKIAGLMDDIHMDTHHFNLTLTIFYISYAVFEPLANVLLKWSKPSIFIPAIM